MEQASEAETPISPEPSYCSVSEAAARLGVSRVSIWRWIRDGELAAARVGHRTTRIQREDLEALLVQFGDGPPRLCRRAAVSEVAPGHHPNWTELAETGHFVQLYESDGVLTDSVAGYMADGFERGAGALVIATGPHRVALDECLTTRYRVDVEQLEASGLYEALDAQQVLDSFMVNGLPDGSRFHATVGGRVSAMLGRATGLRAFGEMVALLAASGNEVAAVALEALWNKLLQAQAFALFCAYPMDCLRGDSLTELLTEVCAEHSRVIPTESLLSMAVDALGKPIDSLKIHAEAAIQTLDASGSNPGRQLAEYLQTIDREAGRLARLVSQLREPGFINPNKQEVDHVAS